VRAAPAASADTEIQRELSALKTAFFQSPESAFRAVQASAAFLIDARRTGALLAALQAEDNPLFIQAVLHGLAIADPQSMASLKGNEALVQGIWQQFEAATDAMRREAFLILFTATSSLRDAEKDERIIAMATSDRHHNVRRRALTGVLSISDSAAAVQALQDATRDSDPGVRATAINGLRSSLTNEDSIAAIKRAMIDESEFVRSSAIAVFPEPQSPAERERFTTSLRSALRSGQNPFYRIAAFERLFSSDPSEARRIAEEIASSDGDAEARDYFKAIADEMSRGVSSLRDINRATTRPKGRYLAAHGAAPFR
jgi:HEAT repeat protein